MGNLISFSLAFPAVPANVLLQKLMEAEMGDFLRPKIGQIGTSDESQELGPDSLQQLLTTTVLLEGEKLVASNLTSLSQYPDATRKIVDFLSKLSVPARFGATVLGDYRLDYDAGKGTREEWIFRYGDNIWRQAIVRLVLSDYGPLSRCHHGCSVLFTIPCPWLFLRNWRPGNQQPYSTPQTVKRNWNRLMDFVCLPIDIVGEEELEETLFSIEGRGPHQESDWLIKQAQRLPKLKLYLF